jgi:SAM-dependent methyltransferase
MATRDIYQVSHELDDTTAQNVIDRLEFRGTDPTFTQMRDAYLDNIPFPPDAYVLEMGCGTGVLARALVKREGFTGRVLGVDQSPALLSAARQLAVDEGVDHLVEFQPGDTHALDVADVHFDTVIAHTLVSHVRAPLVVVKEAARVVKPGGMVALFDGDYASWTHGCSDPELGKAMEDGIIATVVSHPRVMRDMPRLLHEAGLELVETMPHVYAEVGTGVFFLGAAEAYGPLVAQAGLIAQERVDVWLTEQRRSAEDGTFFGASNYYAYLARRPLTG